MKFSKISAALFLITLFVSTYISFGSLFHKYFADNIPSYAHPAQLNLGLDLQGGASIMLEGDIPRYKHGIVHKKLSGLWTSIGNDNVKFSTAQLDDYSVSLTFEPKDKEYILKKLSEIDDLFEYVVDKNTALITVEQRKFAKIIDQVLERSIEIVRHRVDSKGTKEIEIQRKGRSGILVQVPGAKDPSEVKRMVGKTAKLSFHSVVKFVDTIDVELNFDERSLSLEWDDSKSIVFKKRPLMTGEELINAFVSVSEIGIPVVSFELSKLGAKRFADISSQNIGSAIAIILDDKILSAPVIREPILGGSGSISGDFNMKSANELALLLKAGALPIQLNLVEERTIGPGLGISSIEHGITSGKISCAIVAVVMLLCYRLFGVVAMIGLFFNLTLLISIFSILGITLTLPGIAGIVLTIGMAVDANVLIYERIREELISGKSYILSIEDGYRSAIGTILDSNITTIISSIILYIFGHGPISGFSVCLIIGIACSMVTAVFFTKFLISLFYNFFEKKSI